MMETSRNLEIIFNRIKNAPKNFIKFFSNNLPEKMKLYPSNNRYIIKQENTNENFFYTEEEKKKYTDEHDKYFCNIIEKFVTTIQQQNPNFDLSNFYNKFNDIMFFDIKFPRIVNGLFNPILNVIVNLNHSKDADLTVTHELFHATASKNLFSSGFHHSILSNGHTGSQIQIGRWLNEGYTELLNIRYFGSNYGRSYTHEVFLMNKLEHIIGKEKMEQLYINSDLKGLINEINKYLDKKETMSFIKEKSLSKRLLYLQKMYINKCKNERIVIDNSFVSQIENILSVIEDNNKVRKIIGGFFIPKDIKEYISILKANLSNNDEIFSYDLSLQQKEKAPGRSRGFVVSTVLVTILSILLCSIVIFLIIKNYFI